MLSTRFARSGGMQPAGGRSGTRGQEYAGQSGYGDYPQCYAIGPSGGVLHQERGAAAHGGGVGVRGARVGPPQMPVGDSEPNKTLLNYDGNVDNFTEVGSCPAGASWCGAQQAANQAGTSIWRMDWDRSGRWHRESERCRRAFPGD